MVGMVTMDNLAKPGWTAECVDCGQQVGIRQPDRLCEHCHGLRRRQVGIGEDVQCLRIGGVLPDRSGHESRYQWEGFGVLHFGDVSVDGPTVRIGGALTVQLWQQVISAAHSPVTLEARWHPEQGETIFLRGVEKARNQDEILAAFRGRSFLHRPERSGRPSGTRYFNSAEDFLGKLRDAHQEIAGRTGNSALISTERLWQEMGLSRSTFYKYLQDFELGFPDDALKRALATSTSSD